jgi:hypothetical protein
MHVVHSRLVYGEWLRRGSRRGEARLHLGETYQMFSRMGAQALADRTRRELAAAGEKVSTGPASREMQLFISTHTVERHLRDDFVGQPGIRGR